VADKKDDTEPASDRRRAPRRLICVPSDVTSDVWSGQVALIRDVSVTGAYLLTNGPFMEGTRLELGIRLRGDAGSPKTKIKGKVVRTDKLDIRRADLWSWGAAVQFDEPLTGLDEEIAALAERLKKTGLFDDQT